MSETNTQPSLSKVEAIKTESHGLAGTIREQHDSDATHFDEAAYQLLKFHGSYQQDDRDLRTERRRAKEDKAWIFMVRIKAPGGRLTAEQYLHLDRFSDQFCDGTLRITSRQGIQFHHVGRENLKNLIKAINEVYLTTIGACGDVNRNTMCCPVSDLDARRGLGMEPVCNRIADHFAPRSTAYYEIWCDGVKMGKPVTPTREEPIYGATYLPRKFKIAIATPEDNCVDLYTQDLGIEVVHEGGRVTAYDLLVGGGMGFTHGQEMTYPRLGSRLVRVEPGELLRAVETIILIQRDYGGREDRKHARLKYLMDDRGEEWFRAELFRRLGRELPPAGPMPQYQVEDHLGWQTADDGSLAVGIYILNGRVRDDAAAKQRSGLRTLVERHSPQVRLTPRQNIVLAGLKPSDRAEIERILANHGLRTDAGLPTMRRLAMACPALPTCGLALAESERYLPSLLDELEAMGLAGTNVEIRMTGCPNSCVRSPMAEIGVVGRGPDKYALYLGGNQENTRLAYLYGEKVERSQVAPLIRDLIGRWREETHNGTSFGDWAFTQGRERLAPLLPRE